MGAVPLHWLAVLAGGAGRSVRLGRSEQRDQRDQREAQDGGGGGRGAPGAGVRRPGRAGLPLRAGVPGPRLGESAGGAPGLCLEGRPGWRAGAMGIGVQGPSGASWEAGLQEAGAPCAPPTQVDA